MNSFLPDVAGFLTWYLITFILGWITFPILFRMLPMLRDRGYFFSRIAGLLGWGFLFWWLGSLRVLENNLAGQLAALVILAGIALLVTGKRGWREFKTWVKRNWVTLVVAEVLFMFSFAIWAFVRSANPEISGTEKPMELAFVNAILRSPSMPPNDPWLSGYAISYYYFGYVLVAMLVRMSGVLPGVGFNLAISLWFALSASAAYGIVFNLLSHSDWKGRNKDRFGLYAFPIFGPIFLLIASNLEGFLEILHARGLFWTTLSDGTRVSAFWKWLDILDLKEAPALPLSWLPSRYLAWWRASRVLQDYDLVNQPREIIDEFPQFSYLLADLHPHLLAMPFVLFCVAIALNFFHQARIQGARIWGLELPLSGGEILFYGICFGSLGFLNLWDFPFAVLVLAGALWLKRATVEGHSMRLALDSVLALFLVILAGGLLYLPFYLGFSSQAGGLIPSLVFFTRGAHLWVMFAPLFIPVMLYLLWVLRRERDSIRIGDFLSTSGVTGGLLLAASILMFLAGWIFWIYPSFRVSLEPALQNSLLLQKLFPEPTIFLGSIFNSQGQNYFTIVLQTIINRMQQLGGWVTIWILLSLLVLVIFKGIYNKSSVSPNKYMNPEGSGKNRPDFVLLPIAVGIILITIPEFFYLSDQFGWRMNTIFKFYFHAWILLSVSAAYAFIRVMRSARGKAWLPLNGIMVFTLLASLIYTPVMLNIKTGGFGSPETRTLDGNRFMEIYNPDEAMAIQWLGGQPLGVVAEAIGGSYSGYARVSTLTGFPTVLGWPGHEWQWRGGGEELGTREQDIARLYETRDWQTASEIIDRYAIRYIVIANLERSTYVVSEAKFHEHLAVVYEQGSVLILETAYGNE